VFKAKLSARWRSSLILPGLVRGAIGTEAFLDFGLLSISDTRVQPKKVAPLEIKSTADTELRVAISSNLTKQVRTVSALFLPILRSMTLLAWKVSSVCHPVVQVFAYADPALSAAATDVSIFPHSSVTVFLAIMPHIDPETAASLLEVRAVHSCCASFVIVCYNDFTQ
jgi:hypothetical protein